MKMSTQRRVVRSIEAVLLAAVTAFFFYPIYWMVKTAFTSDSELYAHPFSLIPIHPTLSNFLSSTIDSQGVLLNPYLFDYFRNSVITALATTALVLVVASFGAYSLSRFRFRGRDFMGVLFLFTQMIPGVLIIIPFYIVMQSLGLINSLFGLVVAFTALGLPIALWLLRSYFMTIPVEIEESGLVDGANRFQVLTRLVMPLAAPGLVATGIITFLEAWGNLIFAYTLVNDNSLQTVPAGLALYVSAIYSNYGQLMAFSLLATIPPLILFGFILKYYVRGLTAGALKG